MEVDALPCNEAFEGFYECSCVDCPYSCPDTDPPLPEDLGFRIMGLNGITFIMSLIFGVLGIIVVFIGHFGNKNITELPKFFGGFDNVTDAITRTFKWWGTSKINKYKFITR